MDLCIPVAVSMVLSFFWLPLPLPRRHHLYLSLPLSLSPYQLVHHRPSLTQHSARMPHAKYAIVSTCSEKYSPNPDPKVASVAVKS